MKILAASKDVITKTEGRLGVKYGKRELGGRGKVTINCRIYFYKIQLAKVDFNSGQQPSMSRTGTQGQASMIFMGVGQPLATIPSSFPGKGGTQYGGFCPSSWWDVSLPSPPKHQEWTKTWFEVHFVFAIGPVPVKITIKIVGMLGYSFSWGAWYECIGGQSMANTDAADPDAEGHGDAGAVGAAIHGNVDLIVKAECNVGGAKVEVIGKLKLYHGTTPGWTKMDNRIGCAEFSTKMQKMYGKIELIVTIGALKFTKILAEWNIPPQFKTLDSGCVGPFTSGNLVGYPDTDKGIGR